MTARGPAVAGRARRRVDQMVKLPAGAEPPCIASGGRDAAATQLERPEHAAGRARVGDVDSPGARLREERPRRRRRRRGRRELPPSPARPRASRAARGSPRIPCRSHRGRPPPLFDARAPGARVEIDPRTGLPAVERPGLSLVELLERAVVAGSCESRQNRRIEPAARLRTRTQRCRQRLGEPRADRDPRAACAVQPREVALGVETRQRGLAQRDLAPSPRRARAWRSCRRAGSAVARIAQIVPMARNDSDRSARVMPAPLPVSASCSSSDRHGGTTRGGAAPGSGARHQDAREREPEDGSATIPATTRPRVPVRSVPTFSA